MSTAQLIKYSRDGVVSPASKYEKLVMMPAPSEKDPCAHAFADACFAVDIMAEHALFFTLLMPPEIVQAERAQAQQFSSRFTDLGKKLESGGVPKPDSLKAFCQSTVDAIKPFIDYKQKMLESATNGTLRSLVWPLFFKHTLDEAQRWAARLTQLSAAESEYDRQEVVKFWAGIMEEHARFEAHLLDPDEQSLIDTCLKQSKDFKAIQSACEGPNRCPAVVNGADPVLVSAKEILGFSVTAARGIEASSIKSIIDPRLADHLRRETLKFIDEIPRAV